MLEEKRREEKRREEKRRIKWVDISRGIAFLMVIYSHQDFCNSAIMKYFYPIYLSTFFFVSGYLTKDRQTFKTVFEQRTRTLLLPLLMLGTIMIAMSLAFSFNQPISASEAFKGMIFQTGEHTILWFVAALYIYSLFFYWIDRWCSSSKALLAVAILLYVANNILRYQFDIVSSPWHLSGLGFACYFMSLGKLFKRYEAAIDKRVNIATMLIGLAVYIVATTFSDHLISVYGSPLCIDSLLLTTLGIFVCVYFSKLVFRSEPLTMFVGANSLFYFAFHGKVYSLVQALAIKIFAAAGASQMIASADTPVGTAVGFGVTIATALILIIPAILVNRYAPWLLGKGFKILPPHKS